MREKHTTVIWNGYTFEVSLETDVQYEDVVVSGITLKGKTAFPVHDVEIDFHELSAELYVKKVNYTPKYATGKQGGVVKYTAQNTTYISLEEVIRDMAIEAMRE